MEWSRGPPNSAVLPIHALGVLSTVMRPLAPQRISTTPLKYHLYLLVAMIHCILAGAALGL